MRTTHWKLFPGFCLGILVMWGAACGMSAFLLAFPAMMKIHWGVWLALTLVFPILAVLLHCKAEELHVLYLLSYFLNSLGAGCSMALVLAGNEVAASAYHLLAMLPAVGMMAVMCLIYSLCRWDKAIAITFFLIGIVAMFVGLVKLGGGGFFSFLYFLPMPIACGKTLGKPWSAIRYLSFAGFGAYLAVLVGAIMALAEDGPGELFEGLFEGIGDMTDSVGGNQKKQNQPRY